MTIALESIEAQFLLGTIHSEDLSKLASDLIDAGTTSKSLIELVCLTRGESNDAALLFVRALCELGHGKMTKLSALRQFTKDVSNEIVNGSVSPYEGAKRIWNTHRDADVDQTHEFDPFIYAASEMEDRPKERKFFEKAIIEEAKRWSGKKGTLH